MFLEFPLVKQGNTCRRSGNYTVEFILMLVGKVSHLCGFYVAVYFNLFIFLGHRPKLETNTTVISFAELNEAASSL